MTAIAVGASLVSGCGRPIQNGAASSPTPTAPSPSPSVTSASGTPAAAPSATPAPPGQAPSPAAVEAAVHAPYEGMLRPEDVGPQWRVETTFRGDWPTEFLCRPADTAAGSSIWASVVDYDAVVMTDQPPPVPGVENDGRANFVDVSRARWAPGEGRIAFGYLRDRMRGCQAKTISPDRKVTLVDSALVGDESFLVDIAATDYEQHWYSIFVRRGDITAEVFVPDDKALALRLGRSAADRACEIIRC